MRDLRDVLGPEYVRFYRLGFPCLPASASNELRRSARYQRAFPDKLPDARREPRTEPRRRAERPVAGAEPFSAGDDVGRFVTACPAMDAVYFSTHSRLARQDIDRDIIRACCCCCCCSDAGWKKNTCFPDSRSPIMANPFVNIRISRAFGTPVPTYPWTNPCN